jgi:hypothetical protein
MAASSSSTSSSANPPTETTSALSLAPNFSQLFKLEGPNYLGLVAQFQPILRGRANELEGLLDGTDICSPQFIPDSAGTSQVLNPAYVSWQKRDWIEIPSNNLKIAKDIFLKS